MNETLTYDLPEALVGARLDWAVSELQAMTRSAAQNLIEGGAVAVSGVQRPKNYKLRAGDVVQITPPPLLPSDVVPENIPLEILYEDHAL